MTLENLFQCHNNSILIKDIDINKIVVSNQLAFDKEDLKYSIVYKDSERTIQLCLLLLEILFQRHCHRTKYIYFAINDELTFDKYIRILEGVRNIIKTKW